MRKAYKLQEYLLANNIAGKKEDLGFEISSADVDAISHPENDNTMRVNYVAEFTFKNYTGDSVNILFAISNWLQNYDKERDSQELGNLSFDIVLDERNIANVFVEVPFEDDIEYVEVAESNERTITINGKHYQQVGIPIYEINPFDGATGETDV